MKRCWRKCASGTITIPTGRRHPWKQAEDAVCWIPRSWDFNRVRKRSSGSSARGRADEREAYNAALWTVFSSDLHGCQVDLPSAASGHGSGVGKTYLATAHCWWQITPATGDPLVLVTVLPMDYRLRVMGKEELFQNPHSGMGHPGGAFPVNRGRRWTFKR